MQIILLDKVLNLGNFGDQANVKAGYARNFLIPQGKAVLATKKNIEFFEAQRMELETKVADIINIAKVRAEKINALNKIIIKSKAGEHGKLFGSVGIRDIITALSVAGIDVSRNEVRLSQGSLRTIGEHEVNFQVYNGIFAKLIVEIIAE